MKMSVKEIAKKGTVAQIQTAEFNRIAQKGEENVACLVSSSFLLTMHSLHLRSCE